VLVARDTIGIAGTLRLATKKPWAIDVKHFRPSKKPLYLLDMAVRPSSQRSGIGMQLVEQARLVAQSQQADAIRLDAYDAAAGAGGFYAKCGFTEVCRANYRDVALIYYEMVLA
jgi:GNAT superfamily N-acetyltransferase